VTAIATPADEHRESAVLAPSDVEAAYRKHAHSVLRRAERLLGSRHDAREVVQEVFVSLLENPAQFAGMSSIVTWLYATTTHACLNRLRNRSTRSRILSEHAETLPHMIEPCPPDKHLELRRALLDMPEELAQVAIYYHLDSLTYDEIAEQLGCSRRKVAYLLDQLRNHFRDA
jgi:RNA polymerase sigma-70 factor (ECF subfamily)